MLAEQSAVRRTPLFGGTGHAVFVRQADVDAAERRRSLNALFGGPDPGQMDGPGDADILTSRRSLPGPSHAATRPRGIGADTPQHDPQKDSQSQRVEFRRDAFAPTAQRLLDGTTHVRRNRL
jgi:hypothetical protein